METAAVLLVFLNVDGVVVQHALDLASPAAVTELLQEGKLAMTRIQ